MLINLFFNFIRQDNMAMRKILLPRDELTFASDGANRARGLFYLDLGQQLNNKYSVCYGFLLSSYSCHVLFITLQATQRYASF